MGEIITIIFSLLIAFGILLLFLIHFLEIRSYETADIKKIDRMHGLTFEKYLVLLFKKLGYKVKKTKDQYDFGADLIIQKNSETTVVQAKRYKKKVGIEAVQQVVAAKKYYTAQKAIVVTNNYFTKSAIKLAKFNDVELMNRKELIKAINWVKKKRA